jgi:hypothetical protein
MSYGTKILLPNGQDVMYFDRPVESWPGAMLIDGDPDSPQAALTRYFASLQPRKPADPNAKPALSGLNRIAYTARRGPGWCDE